MKLSCYCDHCPNNTCTIQNDGLCYAEWALKTTPSTNINSHHHHYQQLEPQELEKRFNCFDKGSSLFHSLICNETVSESSKVIRKCCSQENHCNLKDDLLPSHEEASRLFEQIKRGNLKSNFLYSIFQEYSDLPLGFKILLLVLLLALTGLAIALVQTTIVPGGRRRRRFAGLKRHLSRLIGINKSANCSPNGGSSNKTHATSSSRQHGEEDCSENSSGKANSDVAVYDTNSMASREPLINSCNMNQNVNSKLSSAYNSNSLNHHHRGPFMGDETYNGRTQSTFQITLGSAQGQPKPETSSGSGAGQPYLTQRSIAHDIQLIEVVGRGYFGVVWRGEYKGEPVAVKIFSPMAEPSWEREAEIYQTTMLRHKNILGFIATDKRHDAAMTGYWLVTEYYQMGSLYDFLRENSMSLADAIRMAFSIANGLSHLHIEIFGTQGKPAIAHRDLKSKNILVKNDGTCCIADLGMAVRYNSNTGIVDVPTNTRVGTRRYLAPETLSDQLNLMDFEAVKATDVYALGLVLWEILRRTCLQNPGDNYNYLLESQHSSSSESSRSPTSPRQFGTTRSEFSEKIEPESHTNLLPSDNPPLKIQVHGNRNGRSLGDLSVICEPYEVPYQDHVSADPTADEMYQVVCVQKVRPPISYRWTRFPSMQEYTNVMCECWYEKPQARLSALRIRKSLGDIARKYFNLNMEYD